MARLGVSSAGSSAEVVQVKALPREQRPAAGLPAEVPAWAPFSLLAIEFGLLVLILRIFEFQSNAFGDLAALMWLGFVIHHFLPMRFRLPFFAALSVGGLGFFLLDSLWLREIGENAGLQVAVVDTLAILALGGALLGICHLPTSWRVRFTLLATATIVLAACRLGFRGLSLPGPVWSILASMFMFRLIVYIYEMYHRSTPTSPARAIAYLFMVPNPAFPLFPIVDYKTFCASYYNAEPLWIYQNGLRQILRGIIQLLLYRLVYHHFVLEVGGVSNIAQLAQFLVTTYLLYLNVSGTFHIIVGLLHLFGFNLPATHHFYYLAYNFTDLWRRINIYWKDFIMKLFFNPAYFRFKRLGPTPALVCATLTAFLATWILHSYQLFWLLGDYQITWQDTVFWWTLALFVLINTLTEAKRGRQRRLTKPRRTVWSETSLALRTIGTFVLMCILWTFWNRPTVEQISILAKAATSATFLQAAAVVGFLALLGLAAIVFGHLSRAEIEGTVGAKPRDESALWFSVARVTLASLAILLLGGFAWRLPLNTTMYKVVDNLTHEKQSELDLEIQRRGYYEGLAGANVGARPQKRPGQMDGGGPATGGPKEWVVLTRDFMYSDLEPRYQTTYKGKPFTINRWGMRDADCEKAKPPGTYRIALLGSSNEMGMGVGDGETFADVIENQLNERDLGDDIQKFEVLNFSRAGHGAFQKLYLLEDRVFDFAPDAIFWVTYGPEDTRMLDHLAKVIVAGYPLPAPYKATLQSIYKKAGVKQFETEPQILNRLKPYAMELLDFVFQRYAEQCRQHGVTAYVIYRPEPYDQMRVPKEDRQHMLDLAARYHLPVLNLSAAYESIPLQARKTIMIDTKDNHANERGHQLLADELYKQLHAPAGKLVLRGNTVPDKR
jgi:hypothetical protein